MSSKYSNIDPYKSKYLKYKKKYLDFKKMVGSGVANTNRTTKSVFKINRDIINKYPDIKSILFTSNEFKEERNQYGPIANRKLINTWLEEYKNKNFIIAFTFTDINYDYSKKYNIKDLVIKMNKNNNYTETEREKLWNEIIFTLKDFNITGFLDLSDLSNLSNYNFPILQESLKNIQVKFDKIYFDKRIKQTDWVNIINKTLNINNITDIDIRERIHRGQKYKNEYLYSIIITDINIKKLPDDFGHFKLDGFVTISNTGLLELPYSFGNIEVGEFLKLSKNNLTSLPDNFPNIEIGYNNIPDSLSGTIFLNGNNLKTLPKDFGYTNFHGDLFMEDNEIEILPDSFGNLNLLGELNLANNNLKDLPTSFKNIKVIGNISLERNLFTTIPECLKEINKDPDNPGEQAEITWNGTLFIGNKSDGIDPSSYNSWDYWFNMIVSDPPNLWGTEKGLNIKEKSKWKVGE